MEQALALHRLQFAFTITFHYIFPQLTMGLALLLVYLKTIALRTGDEHYNRAARFWAKIFGINFAIGVVTGIPMEFQFGTNWARFSKSAGGVIGQTLAMEGVFSFFLESTFLGVFLFGEKRLGPHRPLVRRLPGVPRLVALRIFHRRHRCVDAASASATPSAHTARSSSPASGDCSSTAGRSGNTRTHMIGAVQTGCFVMAGVGAFYLLTQRNENYGRTFVRAGVIVGVVAALLQLVSHRRRPGQTHLRISAGHAGRDGGPVRHAQRARRSRSSASPTWKRAASTIRSKSPTCSASSPIRRWDADVQGLDAFPEDQWPDNIPLLYFSYHIMVGLGTIFIAIMVACRISALARQTLHIALDALDAHARGSVSLHRQHRRMDDRRARPPAVAHLWTDAHRARRLATSVGAGNAWFTLIGFMGMYTVLAMLLLFLVYREIEIGPEPQCRSILRPPRYRRRLKISEARFAPRAFRKETTTWEHSGSAS